MGPSLAPEFSQTPRDVAVTHATLFSMLFFRQITSAARAAHTDSGREIVGTTANNGQLLASRGKY